MHVFIDCVSGVDACAKFEEIPVKSFLWYCTQYCVTRMRQTWGQWPGQMWRVVSHSWDIMFRKMGLRYGWATWQIQCKKKTGNYSSLFLGFTGWNLCAGCISNTFTDSLLDLMPTTFIHWLMHFWFCQYKIKKGKIYMGVMLKFVWKITLNEKCICRIITHFTICSICPTLRRWNISKWTMVCLVISLCECYNIRFTAVLCWQEHFLLPSIQNKLYSVIKVL